MLKKTITYENIDGKEISEDFYFHLTKAELMEMYLLEDGNDVKARLERIIALDDRKAIMTEFKRFIAMSVGYRTVNGKFVKTEQYAQEFMSSEAYSELFTELMSETGKVIEFINGLMPTKLREEVAAQAGQQGATVVELPNSGMIESTADDAAVQAEKPQPNWQQAGVTPPQPTPFPQSLEAAVTSTPENTQDPGATSGEPLWYQQNRYPSKKELMAMGNEEMQFAMKLKAARAFG